MDQAPAVQVGPFDCPSYGLPQAGRLWSCLDPIDAKSAEIVLFCLARLPLQDQSETETVCPHPSASNRGAKIGEPSQGAFSDSHIDSFFVNLTYYYAGMPFNILAKQLHPFHSKKAFFLAGNFQASLSERKIRRSLIGDPFFRRKRSCVGIQIGIPLIRSLLPCRLVQNVLYFMSQHKPEISILSC